jgi:hypothetical protein
MRQYQMLPPLLGPMGCGPHFINDQDLFINSMISTPSVPGPPGPPGPPGTLVVPIVLVNANYAALITDYFIGVNTNSSSVTIALPLASAGTTYVIKDYTGSANVNPISITAFNSIDNSTNALINTPYGSITLVFNSTDWSIV